MSSPEVQDDFLKSFFSFLFFFFLFLFFFFYAAFTRWRRRHSDTDIILSAGELVLTELDHFTVSSSDDRQRLGFQCCRPVTSLLHAIFMTPVTRGQNLGVGCLCISSTGRYCAEKTPKKNTQKKRFFKRSGLGEGLTMRRRISFLVRVSAVVVCRVCTMTAMH